MATDVYLRPLKVEDSAVSWRWRNDAALWKYTGSRPDHVITEEEERSWAMRVIADPRRRNYAICLAEDDTYIGNIYLVNIKGDCGDLGIFIGDRQHHGKGYAYQALVLLKELARLELGIQRINIEVDVDNVPALVSYLKSGARFPAPHRETQVKLELIV